MGKNRPPLPSAAYKSMISGLTASFVVIALFFAAFAAYLFVSFPGSPLYGGVFLIILGVLAAVYAGLMVFLRARLRAARRREGAPEKPLG